MSRSGYSDDLDNWALIMWRGRVASSIRGKRGQKLLKDMLDALDAMPVKELISGDLVADGSYCALGVVGVARGIDVEKLDPYDYEEISKEFDIAEPLVREIEYMNDDSEWANITPAKRWERMRAWVAKQIKAKP